MRAIEHDAERGFTVDTIVTRYSAWATAVDADPSALGALIDRDISTPTPITA